MTMTLSGSGTIGGLIAGGLPDGTIQPADLTTGAPSWNSSGVFSYNSGYGTVAPVYGCRAWVNFNGTGTVAIRSSGNVSSITDNGTGDYTVNYATAMPDTSYSYQTSGLWTLSDPNSIISVVSPKANNGGIDPVTTTGIRVVCSLNTDGVNSNKDFIQVCIANFR